MVLLYNFVFFSRNVSRGDAALALHYHNGNQSQPVVLEVLTDGAYSAVNYYFYFECVM